MMAEATAKMTGRPGVAFVTRGPGAMNAATGVYIAHQDQSPMLLFVGLPSRRHDGRLAFQSIDLQAAFTGMAKAIDIVMTPNRLPEAIASAVRTAASGQPGPVVIGLPEDVLTETVDVADAVPEPAELSGPSPAAMQAFGDLLNQSGQPLLIVGGPGWNEEVRHAVEAFALRFDLPVATSFRCQDYIANRHPNFVGHIGFGHDAKLAAGIKAADLIVFVGARPDEVTTRVWQLIRAPRPSQKIVMIHPSAAIALGGVRADLMIASPSLGFSRVLRHLEPPAERRWGTYRRDLRNALDASRRLVPVPGAVQLPEIIRRLSDTLAPNAVISNGAGNYAQFLHRYFLYKSFRTQLAPACGYMGYGLPAAIAAKLAFPERICVAFAGDGCFQMTVQELATAVQYALPVVVVVVNNGMHGTIRMHQERHYPGRVIATSLVNPDFAALARSYGAKGFTVTETSDFETAFHEALEQTGPSVIDVRIDPEAISPEETISTIRRRG